MTQKEITGIGHRAARAIRLRAAAEDIPVARLCERMGLSHKTYNDWANRDINPCAYWLQQLALAGLDIHWILTGEERT